MMEAAVMLSKWQGDGSEEKPYKPELLGYYRVAKYEQISGQQGRNLIPEPNLAMIRVECDERTLADIAADNRFKVLHRETDKLEAIGSAERSELATWLQAQGVKPKDITRIGAAAGERKEQTAERLRLWLKDRPKATEVKPVVIER